MATAENASVSSLPKSDAAAQACVPTPARSEAAVQAVVTKTDEAVQVTAVSSMKNNAAVLVDVPLPHLALSLLVISAVFLLCKLKTLLM